MLKSLDNVNMVPKIIKVVTIYGHGGQVASSAGASCYVCI